MRIKPMKEPAERVIKEIRRQTRRHCIESLLQLVQRGFEDRIKAIGGRYRTPSPVDGILRCYTSNGFHLARKQG